MFPSTQPRTWNRNSINVPWKLLFMIFPLIFLQSRHSKLCGAEDFHMVTFYPLKTLFTFLNLPIYSHDSKTFPLAYKHSLSLCFTGITISAASPLNTDLSHNITYPLLMKSQLTEQIFGGSSGRRYNKKNYCIYLFILSLSWCQYFLTGI